jgi:hypothetical protein
MTAPWSSSVGTQRFERPPVELKEVWVGNGGKWDPMFAAANLRGWLGHTVIDPEGNKIGLWRRSTSTPPVANQASSRSG